MGVGRFVICDKKKLKEDNARVESRQHRFMASEASSDQVAQLRSTERILVLARWIAVPFALAHVLTYYIDFPSTGIYVASLALVGLLAVANGFMTWACYRAQTKRAYERLGLISMKIDFLVVFAFVWLFTFDVNTAIFVMIYLLPLEAALRYQMRGALMAMAAATLLYAAREWWGHIYYGHDFLVASITFRMGVGWLIALVVGGMASRFTKQDRQVRELYRNEHAAAQAYRSMQNAKDTFTSAMSHEIRTPLTSIHGFAITLRDRSDNLTPQQHEMLDHMVAESRRLKRLLDGLLDFERLSRNQMPSDPQCINLGELASSIANDLSFAQERAISLNVQHVHAMVDERQISRAIRHLLGNACKFTRPGDEILVLVSGDDDNVLLCVDDAGPSIPESEYETIFALFERGSAPPLPSPGIGAGLALTKAFVERQGGRIWVERSPTLGGARFCITIPVCPEHDHSVI